MGTSSRATEGRNEPRLPQIPPQPVSNWGLAATYKLLKALSNEYDKLPEPSIRGEKMILAKVRYMVGQDPFEMDNVTYAEMRQFIDQWVAQL